MIIKLNLFLNLNYFLKFFDFFDCLFIIKLPILGIDNELSGISELIICENIIIDNKVVISILDENVN